MTHDHGDEPFPRHALVDLVSVEEAGRARRQRAQSWVIGAALTLLALGMPVRRVLFVDPSLWQGGDGAQPGSLIAALLRSAFGAPHERAWYLVSAVGWGASLPLITGMLRRLGFAHSTTMLAALTALFAPFVWTGATLPVSFGPGVFGASLLMAALFAEPRRPARVAAALLVASVLDAELLWLVPAVLWAVRKDRRAAVFVATAAVGYLAAHYGSSPARRAWLSDGPLFPTDARLASLRGLLSLLGGLGVAAYGLFATFDPRRRAEESRPPRWIILWCLAFLFALIPGHPSGHLMGAFWVPAAALGLADAYQRKWSDERIVRWGTVLLGIQVALALSLTAILSVTDPLREWRAAARQHLEPTDVVVTDSAERLHLLRARWGLEAHGSLTPPAEVVRDAERASAAERRVIRDGPPRPFEVPFTGQLTLQGVVAVEEGP
ncbi:MAG: hypothetical protein GY711_28525 [bacterium]|nr:hypothetical protein [bacterium]